MAPAVSLFQATRATRPASTYAIALYLNANAIPKNAPAMRYIAVGPLALRLRARHTNAAVTARAMNVSHCARTLTPPSLAKEGLERTRNTIADHGPTKEPA